MNISVIGCGNMATAILKGILTSDCAERVCASDINEANRNAAKALGAEVFLSNTECVKAADVVILAVKPNVIKNVCLEIAGEVSGKLIISIAAGITLEDLRWTFTGGRVIRVMPNTPAMVGEGLTAICSDGVAEADLEIADNIFSSLGETVTVKEALMDAVTALSGSGPAYVFMMIEALADGGVLCGLARADAYKMAAQTVLGSAAMVLETDFSPAQLKDMVCSPAGTTIEAVKVLESKGMRSAFIDAVAACAKKSAAMHDDYKD